MQIDLKLETSGAGWQSSSENKRSNLVWIGFDGCSIWCARSLDLVGVLLGYHGAGYLFCHIWHRNGLLCLLRADQAGNFLIEFSIWKFPEITI